MLTVTWCLLECCVFSGLDCGAAGSSVVCYYLSLRESGRCTYDMGALLWLNVETLERTLTTLLGRLVRCSAHGQFFVTLQ